MKFTYCKWTQNIIFISLKYIILPSLELIICWLHLIFWVFLFNGYTLQHNILETYINCILSTSLLSQLPLQFLHANTHFNPCFLHEQRFELQLFLHLHRMNWRRLLGAHSCDDWSGVYTPSSMTQPQRHGSEGNFLRDFQTVHC